MSCERSCSLRSGASETEAGVSNLEDQKASGSEMRRRALDNLEGEFISDNYQIMRRIGKGGMGVVYLAMQTKLGREVCVKVLNSDLIENEDAVGRFQREARGLSILHHPNIVTIFDYGRDGDLAYIVMEYAQGITLGKYIKQNGAMALEVFLPIAVQILKGIGEAHKLGLIHRDIKPANIMLCELEGEKNFVKILDFGLAKLAKGDDDVTKEHQLVGSASYMSPEQILTGVSDTRTDVYALGVMFYLMLSGRKPFVGPNDNVILYKHVNEIASPLKTLIDESQGVPEALCEVIDQCLTKDPAKRPADAVALLHAISYALDAPQLRAGYSSMSLGRIDLQRLSEEAETHMLPPAASIPQLNAVLKAADAHGNENADVSAVSGSGELSVSAPTASQPQGLPSGNGMAPASANGMAPVSVSGMPAVSVSGMPAVSSGGMPAVSAALNAGDVSSITSATGISFVQPDGSVGTIPVQIISSQAMRDRKFLVLGICLVAAILAAVCVIVLVPSQQPEQSEKTAVIQGGELSEMFGEIDAYLAARKLAEAENFLELVQSRPDAQDVETSRRIVAYKTKIDNAKTLLLAEGALKDDNPDEAETLYRRVLDKDPDNAEAAAGLTAIEKKRADLGRVMFVYDGNLNDLELYVDDAYRGHPDPELKMEAGIYTIRITREGYKDWTKKIQLSKSNALSLDIELEKKAAAKPAKKPSARDEGGSDDDVLIAPTKKGKSGKRQQGLLGI